MSRFVLPLVAVAAVSSIALADLGPPPGQKYVPVTTTVKMEKSFPDHTFYVMGVGPGAAPLTKLDLHPTQATKVDAKSRYGGNLYAVPNSVVKEYKTEKELAEALSKQKLPAGVSSISISNRTTLKTSDKRESIDRVLMISEGDAKGLKIDEALAEKKDPEEPEPTAEAPTGGRMIIVGLSAALALAACGVWLTTRRK